MGKLVFSSAKDGAYTVLNVGGVIDTGVAAELSTKMDVFSAAGAKIICDLSTLEHLTSAGIGVFVDAKNKAGSAGGDMRIAGPSDKILKVLTMMNLSKIITVCASVDEAKKGF